MHRSVKDGVGEYVRHEEEPVEGGSGIVLSKEYMKMARELCTRYKALLIIDEVFTGFGRTGKM